MLGYTVACLADLWGLLEERVALFGLQRVQVDLRPKHLLTLHTCSYRLSQGLLRQGHQSLNKHISLAAQSFLFSLLRNDWLGLGCLLLSLWLCWLDVLHNDSLLSWQDRAIIADGNYVSVLLEELDVLVCNLRGRLCRQLEWNGAALFMDNA